MEINLFSKCIKELIVENDRVDVPYLGTFTAEMMPASYSDRQTTIHPPYRKMSFHKGQVALSEGRLLLDKVRRETGVTLDQAGVELGWCLSRLCSELEGHKSCKLPGLGTMRANARNEFFFVPDDDLDIWPDGLGFEPISIKVSEKPSEEEEAPHVEERPAEMPQVVEQTAETPQVVEQPVEQPAEQPATVRSVVEQPLAFQVRHDQHDYHRSRRRRRNLRPLWIALIVVGVLLVLFIIASYLLTDEMSPILDRLLYTKEELELLGR